MLYSHLMKLISIIDEMEIQSIRAKAQAVDLLRAIEHLINRIDAYYDVDDGKGNLPADIVDAAGKLWELVK